MNRFEFIQYENAERKLQILKERHALELEEAYDSIHPTRTAFDYATGELYVESMCPAQFTAYVVDLQEEHKRKERLLVLQARLYKQAVNALPKDHASNLNKFDIGSYEIRDAARTKVREILSELIKGIPELERCKSSRELVLDMERYDKEIDQMSEEELLQGYTDPLQRTGLESRCIYLRDAQELTYNAIGERLSITTARVKQICSDHEATLNEKELRKWKNDSRTMKKTSY